jgi:hypothetical protein
MTEATSSLTRAALPRPIRFAQIRESLLLCTKLASEYIGVSEGRFAYFRTARTVPYVTGRYRTPIAPCSGEDYYAEVESDSACDSC